MKKVTFITGNQAKADYLARYLGHPVEHKKLDLHEIQSLDLQEIVEHSLREAYEMVKTPILMEDVSFCMEALNGFPGPFVKFLQQAMTHEEMCRLLDGKSRKVYTECVMGYYDGKEITFFKGRLDGTIAENPTGDNGFGFDSIFIPDGYSVSRAELNEEDDRKTYLQIRPLDKLKAFLEGIN